MKKYKGYNKSTKSLSKRKTTLNSLLSERKSPSKSKLRRKSENRISKSFFKYVIKSYQRGIRLYFFRKFPGIWWT